MQGEGVNTSLVLHCRGMGEGGWESYEADKYVTMTLFPGREHANINTHTRIHTHTQWPERKNTATHHTQLWSHQREPLADRALCLDISIRPGGWTNWFSSFYLSSLCPGIQHGCLRIQLLKVSSCYKGVFFPLPHLPLYWLLGGQALGSVERLETFAIVNGDKSINKSINTIELNWKQA